MSNPVWPSTLPPLDQVEFSPALDNIRKSPMETGSIKRRPRVTWVPLIARASIAIDADDIATLDTFIADTLGFTGSFDWRDVIARTTQSYGFLTLPSYSHIGGRLWRASFELIQTARPT